MQKKILCSVAVIAIARTETLTIFRHQRSLIRLWFCLNLLFLQPLFTLAQDFRITDFRINSAQKPVLKYPAQPDFYYILYQGQTVSNISSVVDIRLGSSAATGELVGAVVSDSAGFYRIRRVTVTAPIDSDGDGIDDVYELRRPNFLNPLNGDFDGDGQSNRQEYLAGTDPAQSNPAPLTQFTSSPANGEADVAVTRETILRFTQPLAENTVLVNAQFYATGGGRRILSRTELSSDRKTATLFYLENLPASTRVRVTFDATDIKDAFGRAVDADNDGQPSGVAEISFDTLTITPVGQTAFIGRVFASELVPDAKGTTNTINRPLTGVTITVDGAEESLRAVTDAMGNFKLQPCPAGKFFVHIDGRTSPLSQWPDGSYYPFVGKQWEAAAGRTDNLAGGTGEIYLPLIIADTLQPVSGTADTTITFPSSVISNNPALAGVSITVPANSLFSDNGTRGGRVGMAPVSPDRLPGPLPTGLEFPLVITVQTDGGSNFDQPVAVCFPNLPDPSTGKPLNPGEKSYLYSFNHDTGQWEPIGQMSVSADARLICSESDVGIRQHGWHGVGPPPVGPPDCNGVCCPIGPPHSPRRARSAGASHSKHDESTCGDCLNEKDLETCKKICVLTGAFKVSACNAAFMKCLKDELDPNDAIKCISPPGCGASPDPCSECVPCVGSSLLVKQTVTLSAESTGDPREAIAARMQVLIEQILAASRAASDASSDDVRNQLRQRITNTIQEIDELGDGDSVLFLSEFTADLETRIFAFDVAGEPFVGNAPDYPVLLYASARIEEGLIEIRGQTKANGQYELFVPRGADLLTVRFLDSKSARIAQIGPLPKGIRTLPRFFLVDPAPNLPDSDGDGLIDFVESVYGSDSSSQDTDGDGIKDGAEVDNGTNPLDGLAVTTGIIASADTPGTAVEICAVNNVAIVAGSEAGVSVFNVLAGLNPVRIAQVDTPGTALAVSCSGNLIAVADGADGLQIVDISDPPAARIVRQIGISALGGGSAQAVASAADLAFVGTTSGFVNMVELDTGVLLQRLELASEVYDLTVEGTTLYVYTAGKLHLLPFSLGPMQKAGSVESPGSPKSRGRLFVGNSIAYTVHYTGYNTFDVSNSEKPSLIKHGETTQRGWKQIIPNGSGLGLAAVGVNLGFDATDNVYLHNVSDPTKTDVFLTEFDTPGIARAVSIYNGLGYVADDKSGMQVVNYLAYDNKSQPPTGELTTSSIDGTVTGGGFLVLRAEVKDDVQVRNVEFFVDGGRITVDGNFPFETVYRVPTNSIGNKLTFSTAIFDTGGNTASVTNAPLNVVPDNQPPGISFDSPTAGQKFFQLDDVPIKVTAIDNSGIDSVTFQLNGAPVPVRRSSFFEWQIDLRELPTGTNALTTIATDRAGLSTTSKPVLFVVLKEAISREVSVINSGPKDVRQAISREVSTFNFGPLDKPEAISREVSVENKKPGAVAAAVQSPGFSRPRPPEGATSNNSPPAEPGAPHR